MWWVYVTEFSYEQLSRGSSLSDTDIFSNQNFLISMNFLNQSVVLQSYSCVFSFSNDLRICHRSLFRVADSGLLKSYFGVAKFWALFLPGSEQDALKCCSLVLSIFELKKIGRASETRSLCFPPAAISFSKFIIETRIILPLPQGES